MESDQFVHYAFDISDDVKGIRMSIDTPTLKFWEGDAYENY